MQKVYLRTYLGSEVDRLNRVDGCYGLNYR